MRGASARVSVPFVGPLVDRKGRGMSEHYTTAESEMEFDMDADAELVCVCGFHGSSDAMLDHLAAMDRAAR